MEDIERQKIVDAIKIIDDTAGRINEVSTAVAERGQKIAELFKRIMKDVKHRKPKNKGEGVIILCEAKNEHGYSSKYTLSSIGFGQRTYGNRSDQVYSANQIGALQMHRADVVLNLLQAGVKTNHVTDVKDFLEALPEKFDISGNEFVITLETPVQTEVEGAEATFTELKFSSNRYRSADITLRGRAKTGIRRLMLEQVETLDDKTKAELVDMCRMLKELGGQEEFEVSNPSLFVCQNKQDQEHRQKTGFYVSKIIMKKRMLGGPMFEFEGRNNYEVEVPIHEGARNVKGLDALLRIIDQAKHIEAQADEICNSVKREMDEAIAKIEVRFSKKLLAEAL